MGDSAFRISIRNYRALGTTEPITLEIGDGFAALVGPNNSGKSSALRLFYEMRHVFGHLGQCGPVFDAARGVVLGFNSLGLLDRTEVFTDESERPAQLSVEIPDAEQGLPHLTRLEVTLARENATFTCRGFNGDAAIDPRVLQTWSADLALHDGAPYLKLGPIAEEFASLSNAMYIGAFRNALNVGARVDYYDLSVGSRFVETLHEWKSGNNRLRQQLITRVEDDLADLLGFARLELTPSVENGTITVRLNARPYKLHELGSGLAQFIIVFCSVAIRRPTYILIDESELNLHPSLQAKFLQRLARYASRGVIFATHSIGLARTTADRIYSFQREPSGVKVAPLERTKNYAEFLGEMGFSLHREMAANHILLVEGVSEVRVMREWLRLLGKDQRIVPIPLGGTALINGDREHELAAFRDLAERISVLIDSERTSANAPLAREREAFMQTCRTLGFKVHATDRRATENYFSDTHVKAVKSDKYAALGQFDLLKEEPGGPPRWSKSDNWRIAAEMTKDELIATDVGRFLQGL